LQEWPRVKGIQGPAKLNGRMPRIERRLERNPRPVNAMHHWATVAVERDDYFKQGYHTFKGCGESRGRAPRTIGDRLLRMLCAMLSRTGQTEPPQFG
jgi:hypothetical protein